MVFDIQGFEDRHPAVRSILRAVTVDSINHGAAVALRFEDAAKQLAIALPDGPVLTEILTAIQEVQTRAVHAVDALLTPVNEDSSTPVPPAAAPALTLIPGRDHPITAPPPGTVTTVETDQAPAPGFLAVPDADGVLQKVEPEAAQPAADAPTEPVGDSGPLGASHAATEQQTVS